MIQVTLIMEQYEGEAVTEHRTFMNQEALDKHIDEVLSAPYQGLHIKNVVSYGSAVDPQFRAKDDIHLQRACLLFDKNPSDVTPGERQIAKKAFYICMSEFAGLAPIAAQALFEQVRKTDGVIQSKDHGVKETHAPPLVVHEGCGCSWTSFGSCHICRGKV